MKYKYYREIDVNDLDTVRDKTLTYIKEKTTLFSKLHGKGWYRLPFDDFTQCVPELTTIFDSYDLKPTAYGLYIVEVYTSRYKIDPLHDDVHHHNARINIPILNTEGVYTHFYTNVKMEYRVDETNNVPYYEVMNKDYQIVDSLETKKATVFNIKEPHKVVVPDGYPLPRITLVISVDKDPSFLLETENGEWVFK